MILSVGEILFDHFVDYRRVGGAPFNFSFHLKKLAFPVRFVTRIGEDRDGRELRILLDRSGFSGEDLQLDERFPTGRVVVNVDEKGVPIFEILPDAAFDQLEMNSAVRSILDQGPRLVYFGTLIQRTAPGREFMRNIFSGVNEKARFLCDINLRQGCYNREIVEESLKRADILKLNAEELREVTDLLLTKEAADNPCESIREAFDIELICLTKGERGSEIFDERGRFTMGPAAVPEIADTVGAGDAFSAILAVGYLQGWDSERILSIASKFAADICGLPGALPEEDSFYNKYHELFRSETDGE
jgi:fructokinase